MQTINRHVRVSLVVPLLVCAGMLLPRLVDTREAIHEVRITAREMSFHVEDIAGANPTMALTAGEQVKVTIRNEDRGMLHDFSIPEWGVRTGVVEWGDERSITFSVPATASTISYVCTPHSVMMSGRITVSK
jgi:plastocyanin